MKLLNYFLSFLFLLLIIGCTKNRPKESVSSKSTEVSKSNDTLQKNSVKSEEIETVKSFLKWYRDNQNEIYSFNTIRGGLLEKDSPPVNYYVDFEEVKKEMLFLEKTNFFSQNFLKMYRQKYIDGQKYFKENPEDDGPPFGFEYDYFFRTQDDYETDLKNLDKITFKQISKSPTISLVTFHFPNCGMDYQYRLIKEDNKWKIEGINETEEQSVPQTAQTTVQENQSFKNDSFGFGNYSVDVNSVKKKAPLDWSSYPEAKMFLTRITDAYKQAGKPDFAGYYVVSIFGCGALCIMGFMVDMRDGKIYDLPLGEENSCFYSDDRAIFDVNSRLFISNICRETEESKNTYLIQYVWKERSKTFEKL